MALLTALPFDTAQELLLAYGLRLTGLQPLSAGSVNSNFFLTARDSGGTEQKYFARIYEEQGDEGARFELILNELLDTANLPVARPVHLTNGELATSHEGKPFAIYERLTGDVICQEMVTETMVRSVGGALASVHMAPLGGLHVGPSRFGFDAIEKRLQRVEQARRPDLSPAVSRVRALSAELKAIRASKLPSGLIHGDLFRDNVLIKDDVVAGLLDFESASFGPFVYDLLVTMLAWCFGDELDEALVGAMFQGYTQVRPMSAFEVSEMTTEGSFACIRFASTRLTDFSLRTAPGQKPLRDYDRFFQRLDALQSGHLDRIIAPLI